VKQSWHGAAALAVLVTVSAASPAEAQNDSSFTLQAVRYYRAGQPGQGSQTAVDVFCRVPLPLVTPLEAGGGGAFRFSVVVRDTGGLQLASFSRLEPLRAELLRARGASTVEQFAFAARPGRYTIEVSVTDSATGRLERRQMVVDAFDQSPQASDLLLASDIRAVSGTADTILRMGEVKKGPLVLTTTGRPVLTPVEAKLGYYLELYPGRAETTAVSVRVLTDSGKQVVAVPPAPVSVGAGGGFAYAVLDLAGLPPGRYRMEVAAAGPGFQVSRNAPFGMAGLETIQVEAAMAAAGEWPAGLTEAQLDSAYSPLDYLMTQDERGVYSTLSLEGKRTWLKQFWAKRDPTPGTARNEQREQFYEAIAQANKKFYEGGASARPGWSTDRGRIFIKQGPPDEVYSRKVSASGNPYEVWRYTRSRLYTYIFMDLTRFGNWTLIYTNDKTEVSRPGWDTLLGADALHDIVQQD